MKQDTLGRIVLLASMIPALIGAYQNKDYHRIEHPSPQETQEYRLEMTSAFTLTGLIAGAGMYLRRKK